jgi:hypothetical protein
VFVFTVTSPFWWAGRKYARYDLGKPASPNGRENPGHKVLLDEKLSFAHEFASWEECVGDPRWQYVGAPPDLVGLAVVG